MKSVDKAPCLLYSRRHDVCCTESKTMAKVVVVSYIGVTSKWQVNKERHFFSWIMLCSGTADYCMELPLTFVAPNGNSTLK